MTKTTTQHKTKSTNKQAVFHGSDLAASPDQYVCVPSIRTRPELNSAKLANASFFFDDEPLRWFLANGSLPSNVSNPPGTEPPAGFGAGGRGGAGARLCCFGGSCGGSEDVKLREGKLSALVPPAGTNNPVPNGSVGWTHHQRMIAYCNYKTASRTLQYSAQNVKHYTINSCISFQWSQQFLTL